jgi:hypothetical protein
MKCVSKDQNLAMEVAMYVSATLPKQNNDLIMSKRNWRTDYFVAQHLPYPFQISLFLSTYIDMM